MIIDKNFNYCFNFYTANKTLQFLILFLTRYFFYNLVEYNYSYLVRMKSYIYYLKIIQLKFFK